MRLLNINEIEVSNTYLTIKKTGYYNISVTVIINLPNYNDLDYSISLQHENNNNNIDYILSQVHMDNDKAPLHYKTTLQNSLWLSLNKNDKIRLSTYNNHNTNSYIRITIIS